VSNPLERTLAAEAYLGITAEEIERLRRLEKRITTCTTRWLESETYFCPCDCHTLVVGVDVEAQEGDSANG
jgi:hypothetical protein